MNIQNPQSYVFEVSELLSEVKRLLETSYREIWLEGELSSLSQPASGHIYFSIKDDKAQMRCAMFRSRVSVNRYKPKEGDLVKIRARVTIYEARGDMQLVVQHIEEAGEGLLKKQFEALKQALHAKGLFDEAHKKPLPAFPKRVGIITSSSGAAVQDIISTFKRRCSGIPLVVYPAIVQGETAANSLIDAIKQAEQHAQCDVLIIARGGGSLEDLWCFNDEQLAYTIHQCPIPIVSGVGHEIDFTICDFVSDQRAPTPTAAAELLSPDTLQLEHQLRTLSYRLNNAFTRKSQKHAQQIDWLYKRLVHPKQAIHNNAKSLSKLFMRLRNGMRLQLKSDHNKINHIFSIIKSNNPQRKLVLQKQQTQQIAHRLLQTQKKYSDSKNMRFENIGMRLNTVSPLATLDRGFSIARNKQHDIVRSTSDIEENETLRIRFAQGAAKCQVIEIDSDTETI